MPGVGKSTTAVRLAALLNLAVVVGTDEIRDVMRLYDKSEALAGTSHDRWQIFGALDSLSFKQGYLAHSSAIRPGVMAIINKNLALGESLIIEGVHLAPSLYQHLPRAQICHCLLYLSSAELHRRNLDSKTKRRLGYKPAWSQQLARHVVRVQDHLLTEAKHFRVLAMESGSAEQNARTIINHLKAEERHKYVPNYPRQDYALQPLC
jgi:2-phosphoglycerate kinase